MIKNKKSSNFHPIYMMEEIECYAFENKQFKRLGEKYKAKVEVIDTLNHDYFKKENIGNVSYYLNDYAKQYIKIVMYDFDNIEHIKAVKIINTPNKLLYAYDKEGIYVLISNVKKRNMMMYEMTLAYRKIEKDFFITE